MPNFASGTDTDPIDVSGWDLDEIPHAADPIGGLLGLQTAQRAVAPSEQQGTPPRAQIGEENSRPQRTRGRWRTYQQLWNVQKVAYPIALWKGRAYHDMQYLPDAQHLMRSCPQAPAARTGHAHMYDPLFVLGGSPQ